MDFGYWGLKRFSQLTNRYRSLREYLGDVLEGDRQLLKDDTSEKSVDLPFEVRDDVYRLLESPLPSRGRSNVRVENVFHSLAPYFEAGFFLKRYTDGYHRTTYKTRMHGMFLFGKVFVPPSDEGLEVNLSLPETEPRSVLKGRVRPVLRALQLESLTSLQRADVFCFTPIRGAVFVLICNRPHPWQFGVIEETQGVLDELFGRREAK